MSKVIWGVAGDFSLDRAEVDSNEIETLIENNQCYTTGERADKLKTSKSIKLSVKRKNVFFILCKKNPYRPFGQTHTSMELSFPRTEKTGGSGFREWGKESAV